jgi:Protein kinase domain
MVSIPIELLSQLKFNIANMKIELTIGTILNDRYQLQELLSQKQGKTTYLALNLQSQTLVIIKLVRFNFDFQWDDLKLFEREAATLQNLDHPAIPKYLDYFNVPDGFALVQTYIDAPSLQTLIQQGRKFTEAEAIELADKLLDILTYLHQQHPLVIHRDLKPSNILLGNRSGHSIGDVYLVDFGSVQTLASKEEGTITIVGSYGYMPLEQFGGQTTAASDLYSLGMTLLYLLTGVHPAELTKVDGRVKFTAQISKQFERWLEKTIQPHLDRRFDSAQLAQIALKSEDGSYGDFQNLKPANTKIELYRDRHKLEIIWCDYERDVIEKIALLIYVFLLIPLTILLFIRTPADSTWVPVVGIIGHLVYFSFWMFLLESNPLGQIFGEKNYRLEIDNLFIYQFRERDRRHRLIKLSKHPRSQVGTLTYNPGYTFNACVDPDGNLIYGDTISIPPTLHLYCGSLEYAFPKRFSEAELWWLGKELSDFLSLELQVIYPTPQVPKGESPSFNGDCGGDGGC